MSEYQLLAVRCPKCQTVVQVKACPEEKVVACPKCGTSMKVAAPKVATLIRAGNAPAPVAAHAAPSAAMDDLPKARLWEDKPPSGGPFMIFLVASCIGGALLGVGAAFAFRPSAQERKEVAAKVDEKTSREAQTKKGSSEQTPTNVPAIVMKDEPAPQAIDPSLLEPARAKSTLPPAVKDGGDAQAKFRRALARVQSLERQRRDWLLANAGRQAASGQRVIVWPNERLLQQALQELEMARREAGQDR